MEIKKRYTPESVKVFPLDMERLNKGLNDDFHKEGKPTTTTYQIHRTFALMREPKLCIIDEEFIGGDITDKITFYIHEEERLSENSFRGHCFPTWQISFSLKELEPYLKPEITLAEFTKERRGYNSRISSNEYEWVKYLNK